MFKEGSSPGIEYVERNDTIQEETIQVVIKYTHTHKYKEKKNVEVFSKRIYRIKSGIVFHFEIGNVKSSPNKQKNLC